MELAQEDCGSLFVEAVEKILGSELIYTRVISTRRSLTGKILTDTYNDTTRAVEMLMPLRSFCNTRLHSNNIKQWVTELDGWIGGQMSIWFCVELPPQRCLWYCRRSLL